MARELRDGVWWVECTGVNAYLVADDDGLTLVDAGTRFDAATLEAAVESTPHSLSDVRRVLVTHYDVDHVGGIGRLAVDGPVYVGRADADLLTGERRPSPFGLKGVTQFVTRPLVPTVADERVERVDDGDAIGGFEAYHAPGHTEGHTVYVHQDRSAAFLGDLVVEEDGELRPAPWFLCADTDRNRRSIGDVAARLPDVEVAAMGHGTPFVEGSVERLRSLADAA